MPARLIAKLGTPLGRKAALGVVTALVLLPARPFWRHATAGAARPIEAVSFASLTPTTSDAIPVPAPQPQLGDIEGGSTSGLPVVAYTVQKGDTLSAIAASHHTDVASIEATDGLTDSSVLQPGQTLQVPTQVGWMYTVVGGDWLEAIAKRAGVSVAEIEAANHISASEVLPIGQRLWIPHEPPKQEAASGGVSSGSSGSASGTAPTSSGGLLWPVRGPITSPFGWRYIFGRRDFHDGIDISVPYGTPVHSAVGGTVIGAGWDGPYGIAVRIQTGDMVTMYAHNSRLAIRVGQQVSAGQLISYAGATGNATGPHVHFGVYINGRAVNPFSYLR